MKKIIFPLLLVVSALTSHAAITWSWAYSPSDTTASNQIASAMNQAVATYNTYSDYNYNIPVAYNSGVPTAQASYHGWIEFGGSRGWTVAVHEMSPLAWHRHNGKLVRLFARFVDRRLRQQQHPGLRRPVCGREL